MYSTALVHSVEKYLRCTEFGISSCISLELIAPSEIGLVKKQFHVVLLLNVSERFDRDPEDRS